jgi:signal transduction histidine kinase
MLFDLARKLGEELGLRIEMEITGKGSLDPDLDRIILLVGREALRNAVTHARASRILIHLTYSPSLVKLEVTDDGIGFDAKSGYGSGNGAGQAESRHFGVIGMRERVEEAKGKFLIDSSPGSGTRVTATLPITRRSHVAAL